MPKTIHAPYLFAGVPMSVALCSLPSQPFFGNVAKSSRARFTCKRCKAVRDAERKRLAKLQRKIREVLPEGES